MQDYLSVQSPNASTGTRPRPEPALSPVLVVEDEPGVQQLMRRWLTSSGYPVLAAASAEEALEKQCTDPAAVALCDIRMPGRDGLWLADQLRQYYPETAVIIATGVQEVESAVAGLRHGVVDYLTKPFSLDRLREAVERGLHWHGAAVAAKQRREAVEAELRDGRAGPDEALGALSIESDAALDGILAMLAVRDAPAHEHAQRVSALARGIAVTLRVAEPYLSTIERAALLHDVGKIGLPDSLIHTPGPLAADEGDDLYRTHPQIGYELLRALWPYLPGTAEIVLASHEWFNGSGYPSGLMGDLIPLGSRVVAVADAYDSLTHPRAFRDALSPWAAMHEVEKGSDTRFDPQVVEAFQRTMRAH